MARFKIIFSAMPFVTELTEEKFWQFQYMLHEEEYRKTVQLQVEGRSGDYLYLIQRGYLKVIKQQISNSTDRWSPQPRFMGDHIPSFKNSLRQMKDACLNLLQTSTEIGQVGPGEVIGLESLFERNGISLFTLEVQSDSLKCLKISKNQFLRSINPKMVSQLKNQFYELIKYRCNYISKKAKLTSNQAPKNLDEEEICRMTHLLSVKKKIDMQMYNTENFGGSKFQTVQEIDRIRLKVWNSVAPYVPYLSKDDIKMINIKQNSKIMKIFKENTKRKLPFDSRGARPLKPHEETNDYLSDNLLGLRFKNQNKIILSKTLISKGSSESEKNSKILKKYIKMKKLMNQSKNGGLGKPPHSRFHSQMSLSKLERVKRSYYSKRDATRLIMKKTTPLKQRNGSLSSLNMVNNKGTEGSMRPSHRHEGIREIFLTRRRHTQDILQKGTQNSKFGSNRKIRIGSIHSHTRNNKGSGYLFPLEGSKGVQVSRNNRIQVLKSKDGQVQKSPFLRKTRSRSEVNSQSQISLPLNLADGKIGFQIHRPSVYSGRNINAC